MASDGLKDILNGEYGTNVGALRPITAAALDPDNPRWAGNLGIQAEEAYAGAQAGNAGREAAFRRARGI